MNYWKGTHIRLRGIEPDDAEFFYNWNLETETQRHLAWLWFPTSKASQVEWATQESLKKGENDEYFFVIEDAAGNPVGSINTNTVNRIDGAFKYGVAIIDSERKKGYAREAVTLLLNYFFNELRYNKVNASVYAFNEGSIALHEKMGFTLEGRLRDIKFTQGRYWGELIFGMTKAEFNLQTGRIES